MTLYSVPGSKEEKRCESEVLEELASQGSTFLDPVTIMMMGQGVGSIFKPEDKTRRRMMEKALEDLDPNIRDAVKRLIEDYHGKDLEKKLTELIGLKKTMDLIEKTK